jgi:[ribosomal protein S5]-alanine N-acetyltransferase
MHDVPSHDPRIQWKPTTRFRVVATPLPESPPAATAVPMLRRSVASSDWKQGLPVLSSGDVTLREMRLSDAPFLFALLTAEEVARFISPPPESVEGFERFIIWSHLERQAGRAACFAVVPNGMKTAIGIFQLRQLDPAFETAEWGFAIGSAFWGTGVFAAGARMVLGFAFNVVAVRRLEARAAVRNGRGNGALRKIGAVCEGVLRRSFLRNSEYLDQHLWSMLDTDWKARNSADAAVLQ